MSHVHVLASATIHALSPLAGSLLAATTTAKKSPNSSFTLIFFVLLLGVGYMFLIRPQRQRRQRQLQVSKQISVGDKVMLSSGIIGRVEGFVGDRARIEIAPGMVIEVVRQAVSQRIDDVPDADHEHDGDDSYDEHDHDDLVDDSDHDPYSVPPLETSETSDSGDDVDGSHPSGNGTGGGST
jgi:preprotein translocase subunit YajC